MASFQNTVNAQTQYAFVTDTEHDKTFDEPGRSGYVNITTEVIKVNCKVSDSTIK